MITEEAENRAGGVEGQIANDLRTILRERAKIDFHKVRFDDRSPAFAGIFFTKALGELMVKLHYGYAADLML